MSKSQIVRLRLKFERSSPGNGNPRLEKQLELYKNRQERQLLFLDPGTEIHSNVLSAVQEAGSMLESLRSRYSRSSPERI